MTATAWVRKLETLGSLSTDDRDAASRLVGEVRTVDRHRIIRRENDPVAGVFLLVDGWVSSSTMRQDGGVFISRIHLPGDMMGTSGLAYDAAGETLTALSRATFATVSKACMGDLFAASPRLAALLFVDAMRDASRLVDCMASVARSSAESRVAALIVHLYDRACAIDPAQAESFDFPLTQEDVGDALGLTSVHVSRMMRNFIDRAWLRRAPRALIVKDAAALRALAGAPRRASDRHVDWVPRSD